MSVFEEWNQRESASHPPKAAGSRNSYAASQPSAAPANNPFARGGAGGASPPRGSIGGGGATSGANPFVRGSVNPNQAASSKLTTTPNSDPQALAAAADAADRDRIFSLEPIPWQDAVGGSGVSSVAVGNSLMCLALPGCRILRWRATRDAKPEEVEILARPAKGESIHKVFVDPHGFHCFVALTTGRVYYLHARAKTAKKLSGWRTVLNGQMVESMAFDAPHVSETTTRAVLVGTSGGRLYETVVDSTGKGAPPALVYTLDIVDEAQEQQGGNGGGSSAASSGARIGALHVVSVGLRNGAGSSGVGVDVVGGATEKSSSSSLGLVSGSLNPNSSNGRDSYSGRGELDSQNYGGDSSSGKDDGKLLVLCATDAPTRLYSFLGGPTFADLFGAAEQQGHAAGAASTWTFTELGALSGGQRVELHRYERLDQHRTKAMGRLGVSVVSGAGSAALTDQASLFALLTEHGIYHGGLQVKSGGSGASVQAPSEAVIEPGLLPYPPPRGTPIAIDMTAYHFLALYPDRILCLSRLSGELVQELMLPVPLAPQTRDSIYDHPGGGASSPAAKYMGGFVRDAATNAVFVWSANGGVWQVQVAHEARDVWSLYLDRALASSGPSSSARFDDALRLAEGPQQRQTVLAKQAHWHFDRKEYAKAARTFAKVQAEPWPLSGLLTFEAVTLKLMEADAEAALKAVASSSSSMTSSSSSSSSNNNNGQDDSGAGAALEVFLEEKLRVSEVGGKVQATMLTTWLLECYLKRLIYLPDPNDSSSHREESKGSQAASGGGQQRASLLQEREDLELKLLDFLEEHQSSLDHDTTFQLLDGHGHAEAALKFAMVVEDSVAKFERICAHYASRQQWLEVLHVLDEAPFNKVLGLFYRFSSALMDAVPGPTVVVWKRKPQLNPTKLIPALVGYAQKRDAKIAVEKSNAAAAPQRRGSAMMLSGSASSASAAAAAASSNERNYAVDFLEHCISRNTKNAQPGSADKAIYNYLLLLHAQSHDHGAALLRFLDAHLPSSSAQNSSTRFDLEYALRVCTSTNQTAAAVRVYAALGLHEDAVRLALKVDVPMAKRLASSSLHDYELTRRLWLLVAQHTVATVTDPKRALGILDECPSISNPSAAALTSSSSSKQDPKRASSAAGGAGGTASSSSGSNAPTTKVLTIEDVLPFFGEMATIDDFKAKVVEALETYDAQIDGLKREMDGFAESAREVHRAIDALGERQLTVDPQALCPLSGKRVFDGPFYVFPSGYACAQQPLIAHVTPHLPPHKQRRVRDLCARLGYPPPPRSMLPNGLKLNPNTSSTSAKQQQEALLEKEVREEAKEQERLEALRAGPGASLSASEREAFQTQLDDMVAGECPLTGTLAIEMVDAPLLSAYEAAMERASWAI